ncbi:tRNA-specific adenosine deaminase [Enhygromyxa salina]|uniref:tRNA-specific adenosine deaminase n=2 Tax=Enhygromyxa salina TaxID=215803 RepID=A0A2S9XPW7_9BACT|nr:tRNA-specific adenosine deaminase [Enhygromyxa salina]
MSPTRDEYAMFSAQAVALRSADMSRQVGAVIVDGEGEVLACGCNEVPKPRGGVYWEGDVSDGRDFRRGSDPNAIFGREILRELFDVLHGEGWLAEEKTQLGTAALVEQAQSTKLFNDARIGNLIEFGRVVHAEMNALVYAARRGIQVDQRQLYCTTFPCHVCARHIIGAGIAAVVYIEPYPKSLAVDLYPEAITLGGSDERKLAFRAFTGVAPRRYLDFFSFGRRKDGRGYAVEWIPGGASPRARALGNPHLLAEQLLCDTLDQVLQ